MGQDRGQRQALQIFGWVLEMLRDMMTLWVRLPNNSFPHRAYFTYSQNPWVCKVRIRIAHVPHGALLLSLPLPAAAAPPRFTWEMPHPRTTGRASNRPTTAWTAAAPGQQRLWDGPETRNQPALPTILGQSDDPNKAFSHTVKHVSSLPPILRVHKEASKGIWSARGLAVALTG